MVAPVARIELSEPGKVGDSTAATSPGRSSVRAASVIAWAAPVVVTISSGRVGEALLAPERGDLLAQLGNALDVAVLVDARTVLGGDLAEQPAEASTGKSASLG